MMSRPSLLSWLLPWELQFSSSSLLSCCHVAHICKTVLNKQVATNLLSGASAVIGPMSHFQALLTSVICCTGHNLNKESNWSPSSEFHFTTFFLLSLYNDENPPTPLSTPGRGPMPAIPQTSSAHLSLKHCISATPLTSHIAPPIMFLKQVVCAWIWTWANTERRSHRAVRWGRSITKDDWRKI